MMTRVKTEAEIAAMRESGRMLATVLELLRGKAVVGISTKELADIAKQELRSLGGQPSFLGYQGFPDVLCVSVNDEVVHGIPNSRRVLAAGDLVGLDFGVTYRGMITDAAISVIVDSSGNQRAKNLLRDTELALQAGIGAVRAGGRVGDIGAAVQKVLDKGRYGIVRDLVGHGVGHFVHEEPNIPNYGRAGKGPELLAGWTIAIEPMATLGGHDVALDRDEWTIRTSDGSLSAHFEHTVLVTQNGAEILTQV
jgi:methionyl aminopeptidase